MDTTIVLPLLSAILVFLLGIFVLWQGKDRRMNLTFAAFTFSACVWMFGTFMMFLNKSNVEVVIFWDRIVYIGVVFIPITMYHFGLALIRNKAAKEKILLIVGYFLSIVFLLLIPTKLFIDDAFVYEWGAHTKAQPLHNFFLIHFSVYVILWFIVVRRYYNSGISSLERERIKYCFLAFLVLASIGPLAFLPAYGVGVYPFAFLAGVFFVITMTYAILRHRLMDIRVVVKRSTLFSGLVAVVGLAYVLAAWAVGFLVTGGPSTLRAQVITGLIVATLTAVGFQPLYRWLQKTTDKFLFKNDYRPEELIGLISGQLATVLELKTIKEVLARELEGAMKVEKVEVGTLGINPPWPPFTKGGNNENNMAKEGKNSGERLADYFQRRRDIVVVDELKRRVQEGVDSEKEAGLIAAMGNSGLAVAAPLFAKEELIGILGLGQKKSGDMFTTEDLRTLETISSQAAIAIENARLYEETKGFSVKLQKEVDRQTVELTQANKDLQKLDKAKSDFISIASHQLRTPLSVIKGGISIILEGGVFGSVAGITKEKLAEIYEYNERLIKLVDDLLDLSHMEGGKMKYEFKKVDLAEMAESVVKELSLQADKKKLKLSFVLPKEAIWVRADEGKLRQVVMNLIDNAIKYTDKGSVEVSLAKKDGAAQFAVRDTGMGMTKEELANLFQKFVRGANAPRYHTDGSGIGLYVAKKMIEEHGGQVWAESEGEGKGSTFFVKMGGWEIG